MTTTLRIYPYMATISTISCYQESSVDDYDFTLDDADMGITAEASKPRPSLDRGYILRDIL